MQLSISGVKDSVVDGLDELAQVYDVSRSKVAREALRQYVRDRDEVSEYIVKDSAFEQLTQENTWRMRVMWFESNVREFFNDCLNRDVSPKPERVEWAFVRSAHKEAVEQAPEEFQDEMQEFVDAEFARYKAKYYADNPGEADHNPKRQEELTEYVTHLWEQGRKEAAQEYVKQLSENGNLPTGTGPDTIISRARQKANQDWKDETDLSADRPQRPSVE